MAKDYSKLEKIDRIRLYEYKPKTSKSYRRH